VLATGVLQLLWITAGAEAPAVTPPADAIARLTDYLRVVDPEPIHFRTRHVTVVDPEPLIYRQGVRVITVITEEL
jgi:hypothetical protein